MSGLLTLEYIQRMPGALRRVRLVMSSGSGPGSLWVKVGMTGSSGQIT